MNSSRRRLLKGQVAALPDVPRMPWLDLDRFLEGCTRCHACASACPEGIVVPRDGGLPGIDFTRGGCTFCGRCADACPESLFVARERAPWAQHVVIDERCLTLRGVVCRSCQDVCEPRAIQFPPVLGGVPKPVVDPTRCTACGACTGVCPVDAVRWSRSHPVLDDVD